MENNFEYMFCYEFHEDAGMANDIKSGENAKAFAKVNIRLKRKLSDDEYNNIHENLIINIISNHSGVDKKYIKPVSYEYYLEHADEEKGVFYDEI